MTAAAIATRTMSRTLCKKARSALSMAMRMMMVMVMEDEETDDDSRGSRNSVVSRQEKRTFQNRHRPCCFHWPSHLHHIPYHYHHHHHHHYHILLLLLLPSHVHILPRSSSTQHVHDHCSTLQIVHRHRRPIAHCLQFLHVPPHRRMRGGLL